MRKILGLLAIVVGLVACGSEVKFNDPGMYAEMSVDAITDTVVLKQLVFNNALQYNRFTQFKPQEFKAMVANGKSLVIEAQTDSTRLVIYVPEYEFGARYDFNSNEGIKAMFHILGDDGSEIGTYDTEFSTSVLERPGYVQFDPVEQQVPNTISGKFVINMGGSKMPVDEKDIKGNITKKYVDRKAFQNGVFYRIPLTAAN